VPIVVQQHAEDAAVLHAGRTALAAAPHVKLLHLRRFDDRLAAHLDGLAIAGEQGLRICEAALEAPSAGTMFVATVRALEDRHQGLLNRLALLASGIPESAGGFRSAFGWLERDRLRGVVAELLNSAQPQHRLAGIAASAMHRVDPGLIVAHRLEDSDAGARARALRAAGELGKHELVSTLAAAIADEDPACQFWAAWSAVLLGDREAALEYLATIAVAEDPQRSRAFQLVLQAMPVDSAHEWLRRLAADPSNLRWLMRGTGLAGDPTYVPWLIGHMADDKVARLAGESFSMITGLDLAWLDLERKPPENLETGPTDDPNDANVDMDPDDGLPWPDQGRIQAWWSANGPRFAAGTRHFMGAPLARSHCVEVLKTGFQRQRIAAAYHLCLLIPGTVLFEWRAPAWRQTRELARLV
jgi:uncharacterized protein (TIGR02270 family)